MRRSFVAIALTALALTIAADALVVVALSAGGAPLLAQRGRSGGRRGTVEIPADARALLKGRVTAVDRSTGRVAVDVDGTVLEAEFPPAVVADVKQGDVVFVTVNVINARLASITGPLTAVDPTKGTLTVATPRGPLTVKSSAETLAAMKPGDQIVLKLELVDIGPPFEPSDQGPPK